MCSSGKCEFQVSPHKRVSITPLVKRPWAPSHPGPQFMAPTFLKESTALIASQFGGVKMRGAKCVGRILLFRVDFCYAIHSWLRWALTKCQQGCSGQCGTSTVFPGPDQHRGNHAELNATLRPFYPATGLFRREMRTFSVLFFFFLRAGGKFAAAGAGNPSTAANWSPNRGCRGLQPPIVTPGLFDRPTKSAVWMDLNVCVQLGEACLRDLTANGTLQVNRSSDRLGRA